MNDLISVIVPVYKVREYLDKCVASLVNQTYRNLEIILVDDGSPDECAAMCDAWACNDHRIRVIHKVNGGLSDARNVGVKVATGEYIGFVDSDDWISQDFYEVLLCNLITHTAQISASDITWKYDDYEERKKRFSQTVFSPQQALQTLMFGEGFHATAWNKLYKADLIRQHPFPKGRLHEDEYVTYKLIGECKKLVLCQNTTYYYRQRAGSIMNSPNDKHLDSIDAFIERLHFFKDNFPELYQADKPRFCIMLTVMCRESFSSKKNGYNIRKRLTYSRKRVHYTFKEIFSYSVEQRVYVIGTAISLQLFSWLLYIMRKNEKAIF